MEEIEIMSWLTLDAIKKFAQTEESVGDLQTGHCMSVFCKIEDDYLELCYSDTASNFLRRYEDNDEFQLALERRKEEVGETPYDEDKGFEDTIAEEDLDNEFGPDEESENF
ncbi:MAG: hypothetical protein OEY18_15710 [Candidatus Aminicenantes bacterium]|nr:hypothetical protein [Candidatus Aminicenantes bacterium]MDH5386146.1 hypothetical protein [Candidatus Aminicenantes bacterium]MDH5743548.1 hypothetical protein [Candidatus Aminicenantes bacterium]